MTVTCVPVFTTVFFFNFFFHFFVSSCLQRQHHLCATIKRIPTKIHHWWQIICLGAHACLRVILNRIYKYLKAHGFRYGSPWIICLRWTMKIRPPCSNRTETQSKKKKVKKVHSKYTTAININAHTTKNEIEIAFASWSFICISFFPP